MRGLPKLRERRRQHRRNPSRCQRSTVAGWTSTSPSLHRSHDRRNNSQNSRSEARKRRFERARTPNWCRRARHSSRRSRRVDKANRTAATARKTSGIARRVASHCANVNLFLPGRDNGERQLIAVLAAVAINCVRHALYLGFSPSGAPAASSVLELHALQFTLDQLMGTRFIGSAGFFALGVGFISALRTFFLMFLCRVCLRRPWLATRPRSREVTGLDP